MADAAGDPASGFFASRSRAPREGRKPPPVLVVDDDPEALRYVRDALAAAGYLPVVTGDPQEVSGLIRTKHPHLVLPVLMLPGTEQSCDGFGVALLGGVEQ